MSSSSRTKSSFRPVVLPVSRRLYWMYPSTLASVPVPIPEMVVGASASVTKGLSPALNARSVMAMNSSVRAAP